MYIHKVEYLSVVLLWESLICFCIVLSIASDKLALFFCDYCTKIDYGTSRERFFTGFTTTTRYGTFLSGILWQNTFPGSTPDAHW